MNCLVFLPKGKDNGTYIRVAGTSSQAFPEKIKELEMEENLQDRFIHKSKKQ